MSDLPEPLVPADVDLTDFKFMPLEIARLRKSRAWLICKRRPELAFYLLNLWTAAWHERPAASMEDDDDVLADAAMCSPEKWPKVRGEVMRGWTKCADGRWYHPVVAEKALEAWASKLAMRWAKECDRIRKENKRRKDSGLAPLPFPPKPGDFPKDGGGFPTERSKPSDGIPQENALKGQGQGQGQGLDKNTHSDAGARDPVSPEKPPNPAPTWSRFQFVPPDWEPSAEDRAWVAKSKPDLSPADVARELEAFRLYAKARAIATADVGSTYRHFMIRAKPDATKGQPPARSNTDDSEFDRGARSDDSGYPGGGRPRQGHPAGRFPGSGDGRKIGATRAAVLAVAATLGVDAGGPDRPPDGQAGPGPVVDAGSAPVEAGDPAGAGERAGPSAARVA